MFPSFRAAEILNTVRRVNGDEPIPEMEVKIKLFFLFI